MLFDPQKRMYKKKNPRAPFIRQIILYSIFFIICLIVRQWLVALVFAALIAFAAFMLHKKWKQGSYSLADYIHEYDEEFPTEDPDVAEKKRESKDSKEKRKQEYEEYLAKLEEEYDNFDYGDDESEDDEDE